PAHITAVHSFPTRRSSDLNLSELDRHDALSPKIAWAQLALAGDHACACHFWRGGNLQRNLYARRFRRGRFLAQAGELGRSWFFRSEEHTSELQSRFDLVCR